MKFSFRHSLALPLLLATVATPALAQDKERARMLLGEGNTHVEAREWEKALEKFWSAYRAFPSPKILINIGSTYMELDRPVDALDTYEKFLREAPRNMPGEFVTEAKSGATKAAGLVGEVVVDAPPGTDVAIDDQPAGRVPIALLRAKAGPHKVTLDVPGRGKFDLLAEVKGRERTTVRLPPDERPAPPAPTPVAATVTPAVTATPPAPAAEPAPAFYQRWPFWAGVGVVVAGAVVGGVLLTRGGDDASSRFEGDDFVVDTRP
ncbi:MAG: hypothetical protein AABZ30_05145 [Myxococcota bacterium]